MSERPRRTGTRERQREQTRRRIVEAAVELHSTIGPSRTSLSAVARQAGVTRPTLYAYFPDEMSLFKACSAHGFAVDPPPDPRRWVDIANPWDRLRLALTEMYAYYRRNSGRIGNIERDAPFMKMPDFGGRTFQSERRMLAERLGSPFPVTGHTQRLVLAAVRHALEFGTWRTLTQPEDLSDTDAVDLMIGLVEHAVGRGLAASSDKAGLTRIPRGPSNRGPH
jgi:AcrR family transcriptional regulator